MTAVNKLAVLERARDLIAAGWTQDEDARDGNGRARLFSSEVATCFCISGALSRAAFDLGNWRERVDDETMGYSWYKQFSASEDRRAVGLAYQDLENELGGCGAIDWNDAVCRTQAEVLNLLDKVIDRLKAEEQK